MKKPKVSEIKAGSVIENVAQTRMLAETTLGTEVALPPTKSTALIDEDKNTNNTSNSQVSCGGTVHVSCSLSLSLSCGSTSPNTVNVTRLSKPYRNATRFILSFLKKKKIKMSIRFLKFLSHDQDNTCVSGMTICGARRKFSHLLQKKKKIWRIQNIK